MATQQILRQRHPEQNQQSDSKQIVGKLSRIWRDKNIKNISLTTTLRISISLSTVFLCGSECWPVKKRAGRKILAAEMS